MTFAVFDFAAIAKLTKAFAEEPPQNEVKPAEGLGSTEESHVYGYDVQPFPVDYSCWAYPIGTLMNGPRPTRHG